MACCLNFSAGPEHVVHTVNQSHDLATGHAGAKAEAALTRPISAMGDSDTYSWKSFWHWRRARRWRTAWPITNFTAVLVRIAFIGRILQRLC